jgi:hypothetical protein
MEGYAMSLALLMILASNAAATADPAGEWRGTSLCQVRPSPCNDEQVVYHIARSGAGYRMVMSKLVGGEEQDMGDLEARFDSTTHMLTGTTHNRQGRPGVWRFQLTGDHMSGKLLLEGKTLFRLIELTRDR